MAHSGQACDEVESREWWVWRYFTLATALFVLPATAFLVYTFAFPGVESSPPAVNRCVSRLKGLGLAVLLYEGDNDERTPPLDWMTATAKYTKGSPMVERYRCPEVIDGFGYAMVKGMDGKKISDLRESQDQPLFFDSTDLAWNATAGIETLAFRHDGKGAVSYADSHVRAIKAPVK